MIAVSLNRVKLSSLLDLHLKLKVLWLTFPMRPSSQSFPKFSLAFGFSFGSLNTISVSHFELLQQNSIKQIVNK